MLLDVNALVALAWDSHIHHAAIRGWFAEQADSGWATCSITELGFVRVSSNPKVLAHTISVPAAIDVLALMRDAGEHRFLADDLSVTEPDAPIASRHRLVTDAHLIALARRHGTRLLTFDRTAAALAGTDALLLES